jgi:predicted transcriptional regulator
MYGFRTFINDGGEDVHLIQLYLNNPQMRISELAEQFGKSEAEIYRILHANDVSPNRLRVNHQKVKNLAQLGWGIREIAEFTGYTPRNVRYILAKNITE